MQEILARAIIEMVGTPKEYLQETVKSYVDDLKENGLVIEKEVYAEPEDKGQLFSTFMELDIRFKDFEELLSFCFDSMPSSVEIIEPEHVEVDLKVLTDFLNDLQSKLHQIDMLVKTTRAQKEILDRNALTVFQNFIAFILKQNPLALAELSKPMGVAEKDLKPFLDRMIEQGKIKEANGVYSVKNE